MVLFLWIKVDISKLSVRKGRYIGQQPWLTSSAQWQVLVDTQTTTLKT